MGGGGGSVDSKTMEVNARQKNPGRWSSSTGTSIVDGKVTPRYKHGETEWRFVAMLTLPSKRDI